MQNYDERNKVLLEALERQPYLVEMGGLSIEVCKSVFPPDIGYTSKYFTQVLAGYSPERALDIGCGTGFIAFTLSRGGAAQVWATDIHLPAVKCAIKNAKRNNIANIKIGPSDLFENIPIIDFDLIIFSQPYYPIMGEPIFGMGSDGGKKIINRFLIQAGKYLSDSGAIIMSFSDMAGKENDPKDIAELLGYTVAVQLMKEDSLTGRHFIYEIRP
ncbi:MAG: class I SAM-dependent methyltransferase [Desulfobacteraceae bacterium]|nr:class I SAM-dependent methyltransferase [Desulfobacteraceae bacterium]